jgi:hypothetical protein
MTRLTKEEIKTRNRLSAQKWRDNNPDKLKKYYKATYDKNPEKAKHKARLGRFKGKYWPELTLKQCEAEWNRLFTLQNGLCSICKKSKSLDVEHCHKTGKVRSLACNGCNTALARIEEDPEIARALIAYIGAHVGI